MTAPTQTRILIVAFDALRPDMVNAELMPALSAFAKNHCFIPNARAVFPTETRVNQAALVSGCYPASNGIVGNKFFDSTAAPDKLLNTGDPEQLAAADKNYGGRFVDVPVLGEILQRDDLELAVVSGGTPGGTHMLHHKAEILSGFRFSLHRPDVSTPQNRIAEAIEALGPIPPHKIPSLSWLDYVADCYMRYVDPVLAPAVTILWFPEPDSSYHLNGIGSPENLSALRHLDGVFARLLAYCKPALDRGDLQLLTLSDHGQIAVEEEPLRLKNLLQNAGFQVGRHLTGDRSADVALALESAGGIYVRDRDPELLHRLVGWLQQQDWCGPLFTRDQPGTLRHADIGMDHNRAGDILLAFAADREPNRHNIAGRTRHDAPYPVGGGTHGGLSAIELNSWMAFAGSGFKAPFKSSVPAGIVDILPTVLTLLNITPHDRFDGRVLSECLAEGRDGSLPFTEHLIQAEGEYGHISNLSYAEMGRHRYLNAAWAGHPATTRD